MKNPFLNTEHYTVVQEFNKISCKKRSYSHFSYSYNWSPHSSKIEKYDTNYKKLPNYHKTNQQYLLYGGPPPVYEIQRKRAEFFGIQELRYKPSYYQEVKYNNQANQHQIQYKKQPYKKQTNKKIPQNNIKTQKSLKSIKQIKFTSPSSRSIRQQVQQQNKSVQPKNAHKIAQDPIPVIKRKNSVLEQLVQINFSNPRLNQFYSSSGDLMSKNQLYRTSLNSNSASSQQKFTNRITKYSHFKDRVNQSVQQTDQQYCDQQLQVSQCTQSRLNSKSYLQLKQSTKSIKLKPPPIIHIRMKQYYLY